MAPIEPRPDFLRLTGIISAAVRNPANHGSLSAVTRDLYETYKQQYLALGEQPPPLLPAQVNPLLSVAFEQRRAEGALARARATFRETGLDQAITREMMARDFDVKAGAGTVRPVVPRIRYAYLSGEGELAQERFVTWNPEGATPATVAQLQDALEADAAAHAEDYGEFYSGLTDLGGITFI